MLFRETIINVRGIMERERKRGIANLILGLFCSVIVTLTLLGFSLLSIHYNQAYDIPKIENCSLNVSDYKLEERKVDYLLNGDFEFFYHQWIESEATEENKTGIITLPSHWNDSFALPSVGYASYRIRIDGVRDGDFYSVVLNSFRAPFRAFINHKLVAQSGTLSKEAFSSHVSGFMDLNDPYEVKNENSLILTLEIGYNTFGGFYSAPWLTASHFSNATASLSSTITLIITLMIGTLLLLCVVSFFFFRGVKKTDRSFLFDFLLCLFLMLNQLTCKDGSLLFSKYGLIDYRITACFSFVFLSLVILSLVFKVRQKTEIAKYALWVLPPLLFLIAVFSFTKWNIFFIAFLLFSLICLLAFYLYKNKDDLLSKTLSSLSITLVIALSSIELLDYLGFFVFGSEGIVSLVMTLIALTSVLEIGKRVKHLSKEKEEGEKTKKDLHQEKAKSLALQIQPHFIFNSLSSIQSLYRESNEKGEDALITFSSHLRHQIDSFDHELIPFAEEMENIQNYAHLFSLEKRREVDMICNIDVDDFLVPAFSLEPFVENSLKHGKLDTKEDGLIVISTHEENNVIVIQIEDNGVGFSKDLISEKSHGMDNAKARLSMLLGADVEIVSSEKGVMVNIRFERKKK